MSDEDHPFKPGVRVAVRSGVGSLSGIASYHEEFVDKVYKSGRFTLRGVNGQWRPSQWRAFGDGEVLRWEAHRAGGGSYSEQVLIWDAATEKEVAEAKALADRRARLSGFRAKVDRLRAEHISDETMAALEAALEKST